MTAMVPSATFATPLDQLEMGGRGRIQRIDWALLDAGESSRLKQFGFDEGVVVEPLHSGPFGRDPLAVRVGRMTVAIRRTHASAIQVVPARLG
jgi:ferrous iron transport protein A